MWLPSGYRYHNPENYTLALGGVLRSKGASWQRLMRHASQAGLRYHAPALEQAPVLQQLAAGRDKAGRGGKLHQMHRRPSQAEEAQELE